MSLRVLRLASRAGFLSADTFEEAFRDSMHGVGELHCSGLPKEMLDAAEAGFDGVFGNFSVVCPDYRYFPAMPQLAEWRNRAGSQVAFCLIAHSPGGHAREWGELGRLLTARDTIVAPTQFARSVIELLNPALAPRIVVQGHPLPASLLEALSGAVPPMEQRLLILSRIIPDKLIHRALDAMQMLAPRHPGLKLAIAGSLLNEKTGRISPYAGALRAQVRRCGLEGRVEFLGEVRDVKQKAELLLGSAATVNLSCTMEESFGKAVMESLCAGRPVVATLWNGFPETVGDAGALVPVVRDSNTGALDVEPAAVAEAIEAVLRSGPLSESRVAAARRACDPAEVGRAYGAFWERAEQCTAESCKTLAGGGAEPSMPPNAIEDLFRHAVNPSAPFHEPDFTACLRLLDTSCPHAHLLLARMAKHRGEAARLIPLFFDWQRRFPDHFASQEMLVALTGLLAEASASPALFDECIERMEALDADPAVMAKMRRVAARTQMESVFG